MNSLRLAVVTAGVTQPSSTRLLADRLTEATLGGLGEGTGAVDAQVEVIEVRDIDDLVDICKAFGGRKLPKGNRVAIATLSGGAGVLLADRCTEEGLTLPPLADATVKTLREFVAPFATVANPVDATPQGYNDNYASYNRLLAAVIADPNIDSVIANPSFAIRCASQGGTCP